MPCTCTVRRGDFLGQALTEFHGRRDVHKVEVDRCSDCEGYEKHRNKLIRAAQRVGTGRAFLREMDRLYRENPYVPA